MSFQIKSRDIVDGQPIDRKFTMYGDNVTPNISWSRVPKETKELLLICYDPDALYVANKVWVHWLVTSIDPNTRTSDELHEIHKNDFGLKGYNGPKPPPNSGVHHYHFKIIALDTHLKFKPDSKYLYARVMDTINRHVIAESEIVGTYEK